MNLVHLNDLFCAIKIKNPSRPHRTLELVSIVKTAFTFTTTTIDGTEITEKDDRKFIFIDPANDRRWEIHEKAMMLRTSALKDAPYGNVEEYALPSPMFEIAE